MKTKKGFTLIELLAVLVILAIISLVTVPLVIGIINNANMQSAKRSFEGYIGAVENAMGDWKMQNPKSLYSSYTFSNIDTSGHNIKCQNKTAYDDGSFRLIGCALYNSNDEVIIKLGYYNYINDEISGPFKTQNAALDEVR